MKKIFLSHSSTDDDFVRRLRQALDDQGIEGEIDSRLLRGGDPLWSEIQHAIEEASAYIVLVSLASLQSEWVGQELHYALELQRARGKAAYPVIPLALDGTRLGMLEGYFSEEPVYLSVSSAPGGLEAAMNDLLVALNLRAPADVKPPAQPAAEPLEELVLELRDLKIQEQGGKRRASGLAKLIYEPADQAGQRAVASEKSWRLVAPLGPIEVGELRWYLEQYAVWPSGIPVIRERAGRVEENLKEWGRQLYTQAMPVEYTANVLQAWAKTASEAQRRFSVLVDETLEAGATKSKVKAAREAATLLLSLPWELLHGGEDFLFQGTRPVRVRRRLPNTRALDAAVLTPPIRILLVSARPEDEACGYFDHRASALPLVEAMEALPGQVQISLLKPPTLPALRQELERARKAEAPYHVVHFDGHGVYDPAVGLGGLCFEHPEDADKLGKRRHITVYTQDNTAYGTGLGALLRDQRIPLVFLDACETAEAERASESVASELLKDGVTSVVAMTHSVLVETARRFVQAFYQALAQGERVGAAMLAGQRRLKEDTGRGRVFGTDELRLEDWFVPVLYQEKADPQLFHSIPAELTLEAARKALEARLGELPEPPGTGFVGRSRELLALERLLLAERYAVVRGQGGEGKTALAAEFARWMVRSQQAQRAAFVSVETHGNLRAVVDALGRQLVGPDFSAAGDLEPAILQVERSLREQASLLVLDNMESLLLPPFMREETPEALSAEAGEQLQAILGLCRRLLKVGLTRLVFTSREALPAPFEAPHNRLELGQLAREDAVKLVERALNAAAGGGLGGPVERQEPIEALVEAVNCHARTLALLAPALQAHGAEATRRSLEQLMAEMERRFHGSREQSVFASVELSLRRLSPVNRERAEALGAFHGGVQLGMLRVMMEWKEEDIASLAGELVDTGLATPDRYDHLTLNPAVCPYLRGRMEPDERNSLSRRWAGAMRAYVGFLVQQQFKDTELAATLTGLELPDLFALLDFVQAEGEAEATIHLATSLYILLQNLGRPGLVERVGRVRDAAAQKLEAQDDSWTHARFNAGRTRIEQQLESGQLQAALQAAQVLLRRAQAAGAAAYAGADYDLAVAFVLLARVLKQAGGAEQALPLLDEACQGFAAIEAARPGGAAAIMASICLTERGDCLSALGRFDEAAAVYEENIDRAEKLNDTRQVAVGKMQLGTVRWYQERYQEALEAYAEARQRFMQLDEPGSVARTWHQTGMAYQAAGQPEAAEQAYRKALVIKVRLGDAAGQASTLLQLGNLYGDILHRLEEAAAFYRQAADKYVGSRDVANEGRVRNNLAETLRRLGRLDEARQEVQRALACKAQFGHAATPWTAWSILSGIESDASNPAAAAAARDRAVTSYLAYRRDGGENYQPAGRIALAVIQALQAGQPVEAGALLQQLAADPRFATMSSFLRALQAVLAGSRDRSLASDPGLDFIQAAEVLFLIETLEHKEREGEEKGAEEPKAPEAPNAPEVSDVS